MRDADTAEVRAAIIAGCIVAFVSFGFAATFGVFLKPMSEELGWGREVFSLSMAVQAIFWGCAQPLAGMVADRFGSARVLAFGAVLSAIGFFLRGIVSDPTLFVATGVLAGIGTGACSFPIVIIALGKVVSAARRSFILGLGTAAASSGMFVAAPASVWLISVFGWQTSIFVIAASFLLILPACGFIARVSVPTPPGDGQARFGYAIATAFKDKSYVLLFFGFFVCGFQVAFITAHFPKYINDLGLSLNLAVWGIASIAASLLGGFICAKLAAPSSKAPVGLAVAVVILGLVTAFANASRPDPGPRDANLSTLEAGAKAIQPAWTVWAQPAIGALGVLAGARLGRKTVPARA